MQTLDFLQKLPLQLISQHSHRYEAHLVFQPFNTRAKSCLIFQQVGHDILPRYGEAVSRVEYLKSTFCIISLEVFCEGNAFCNE